MQGSAGWKWDLVCEEVAVHDILEGPGEDEPDELVFRIGGAPTPRRVSVRHDGDARASRLHPPSVTFLGMDVHKLTGAAGVNMASAGPTLRLHRV